MTDVWTESRIPLSVNCGTYTMSSNFTKLRVLKSSIFTPAPLPTKRPSKVLHLKTNGQWKGLQLLTFIRIVSIVVFVKVMIGNPSLPKRGSRESPSPWDNCGINPWRPEVLTLSHSKTTKFDEPNVLK